MITNVTSTIWSTTQRMRGNTTSQLEWLNSLWSKSVLMHGIISLFIAAKCGFVWNYKHVHKPYTCQLQILWGQYRTFSSIYPIDRALRILYLILCFISRHVSTETSSLALLDLMLPNIQSFLTSSHLLALVWTKMSVSTWSLLYWQCWRFRDLQRWRPSPNTTHGH